jgi:hypothetical protein
MPSYLCPFSETLEVISCDIGSLAIEQCYEKLRLKRLKDD